MRRLAKLSGAGNDFLATAAPVAPPSAEEVRAWCSRGHSFGADGFFHLTPIDDARLHLDYWNADGGTADLCVNATRCAVRFAVELGWTSEETVVETGGGEIAARILGRDLVELNLPAPTLDPVSERFSIDGATIEGWLQPIGVPHLVLPTQQPLADAPITSWGRRLRFDPACGPDGANVNFVRFVDAHSLEIRTYERGVEGETLACGSGVLAAVACGVAEGQLRFPVRALTRGGSTLEVTAISTAAGARWLLRGDARFLGWIEAGSSPAFPPLAFERA